MTRPRILYLRTDRLGETLLTLPALAALKAAQPDASLTVLVRPELEPLLRRLPGLDHVLTYAPARAPWWWRAVRLSRRLAPHRFDVAIVSNPMKELHLAVRLAGIPRRIGYARKWGWCLTDRLADRKAVGDRHEVEYNIELIQTLGLGVGPWAWRFKPLSSERSEVDQLLAQQRVPSTGRLIVIHPWTSNPAKQWPADRYRALIEWIRMSLGIPVAVIGGPEEAAQAQAVLPAGGAVADLVGRLSVTQLAALLQRTTLLISNDSGPMHLAAAVQTRTVALFGAPNQATGPTRWGPWGEGHTVIWKPSMDAITVEEVFAAVRDSLRDDQPATIAS